MAGYGSGKLAQRAAGLRTHEQTKRGDGGSSVGQGQWFSLPLSKLFAQIEVHADGWAWLSVWLVRIDQEFPDISQNS